MSNYNEFPLEDFQSIDWTKITSEQAERYGLILGTVNDALEAHTLAKATVIERLIMLAGMSIAGAILTTWAVPMNVVIVFLSAFITINIASAVVKERIMARSRTKAIAGLRLELSTLPHV